MKRCQRRGGIPAGTSKPWRSRAPEPNHRHAHRGRRARRLRHAARRARPLRAPPEGVRAADTQSRARDLVAELRRTLDALGLGAGVADRVDRAEKLLLDTLFQAESDPAASAEMTVRALRGVVAAFAVIKAPVEDHRSTIHYVTARIMELAGLVNERNAGSNNTDWLEKRQQRVRRAVARFETEHGTGSALDDDSPPPAPSSAPAP